MTPGIAVGASGESLIPALALTVMIGLGPAIRGSRVPRPMAGTSPATTVKVMPKANRF